MKFDSASQVEQVAYDMKLADFPRATDRQRINDLLNGVPPYTGLEAEQNGIVVNVNFLEGASLAHDARMQITGNLTKPGRFFSARTDMGAKHKRTERSAIVTRQLAKIMKRSPIYYETFRSKFALDVAHGIGPSAWDTEDFWCPDAKGIEDVLIPSGTLLTMKNLPFFSLYHSYTGPQLIKLTRNREYAVKCGWNMELVDKCLEYIDREATALMGTNWPEVWSPEKMGERVKGDGGFYASDQVPTIDCFDFYFWDDDDKTEGWKRRIILDAWSTPSGSGIMQQNSKVDFARNQFLFTSGKRKVADSWRNIVAFQFADLSAVAPFRYHSIRSLGYLLYAVCNLQNRLRCKFSEAVFEAMLMYFRVKNMDDAERSLKIELASRGFVDETVQFIPANERFQINANLVELLINQNQGIINKNTASYAQNSDLTKDNAPEKTKFQVMAELQTANTLISSGLQQVYRYQEFEYHEIFRRFCMKYSRDPDVKTFRANCLARGIPEEMLSFEAWEIDPERVLGAGNKTLEMAIAQQLMQFRNLYDPEPQRQILRDVTLAITDDPGRTEMLVPQEPEKVTDSTHDAELVTSALMMGIPVQLKTGMNHIEYVETMMHNLAIIIAKAQQKGGMATADQIEGMGAIAQHISQHIELVAQDENEKERVTGWQKNMTKLMNFVKAFAQRLQEQMKKAQEQQGNGADPKDVAKAQAAMMLAKVKADNTKTSHAQRTAQRQLQWEMEQKRKDQELIFEQQRQLAEQNATNQERMMDVQAEAEKTKMALAAEHAGHRMALHRKRIETDIDLEAEKKRAEIKPEKEE